MEIQQELNHKICLIGYGYWGKILHKNLISLGYQDITIVDVILDNFNLLDDSFSHQILLFLNLDNFINISWCVVNGVTTK